MAAIMEVQNIAKKFAIGERPDAYRTLSGSFRNMFSSSSEKSQEFWALQDISFDLVDGGSLAIIGKNGAGKTTLLKILSKITPPDKGRVISRGTLSSLLEVGTGFHPELTGRENIYLNGSILGLKRAEINQKFDEIVDFSGVEKFIDTPIKRYSSGMKLRLAFSVAAHLEPDILAIDEVLAVGDTLFQQKCIDKMTSIQQSGRTILFVSHNMTAVRNLCDHAMVLDEGKVQFQGKVEGAIDSYQALPVLSGREIDLGGLPRQSYKAALTFEKLFLEKEAFDYGEKLKFRMQLKSRERQQKFEDVAFGINIIDRHGICIYHVSNQFLKKSFTHENDEQQYHVEIDNNLKPGIYRITLFLTADDAIQDWQKEIVEFHVNEGNPYQYGDTSLIQGKVFPGFNFTQK